ncbi:hypothetical protein K458DRAFT_349510 [Lentithecium fluviatile CBS 122367]|uniref:Saccharopine dehydrogenase NADP binding domain-containing protein n=1 Tax=Lentithecium fluviatile CBS 122367 TaxID=1168545 RepID=A0A6G1IJ32_9PLEO|nr:hypothetical protein K458DRAFT_349510 [Lentithecium fluviatile CBS 122367]
MTDNARQYELVLLGATGYTGKLTAEWISTNLPADMKWAIAGRNGKKLQGVIDELKALNPDRKQPAIETCELKIDQLLPLAKKTRLIIATIGPFMHHGEPALAACAESGTHYLDCTGEVPWIYDMIEKYHSTAQKNGAIIIPECGIDSVPADLTTFALTNHIRKTLNAPTANVILSLVDFNSGISGGTSLTILELFNEYSLSKMATALQPFSLSPVQPAPAAKTPRGSVLYRLLGLLNLPELGGIQTTHVMASVDTCITHRSWGLYETSAKDTSNPLLSYGPRFRFEEHMRVKSLVAGLAMNIGVTLFGILFAFPPSRWILAPLIKRFVIPQPGQGPSKEAMKKEFMSYRAIGYADTEMQEKVLATLDVAQGGYGATAMTLSAAAAVILRGRLGETEAGRLGGGILTPATLGEQLTQKLDEFGMKIKCGV